MACKGGRIPPPKFWAVPPASLLSVHQLYCIGTFRCHRCVHSPFASEDISKFCSFVAITPRSCKQETSRLTLFMQQPPALGCIPYSCIPTTNAVCHRPPNRVIHTFLNLSGAHTCMLVFFLHNIPCGFIAATRGAWALGACAMRDEHVTVTLEQMRRRSTTQYQTPTTTC